MMTFNGVPEMDRRKFLGLTALLWAAGCSPSRMMSVDQTTTGSIGTGLRPQIGIDAGVTNSEAMYGEMTDNGFVLPAIPYKEMEYRFRRQRLPNDMNLSARTVLD